MAYALIVYHFMFDWLFQTRWEAENKTKNIWAMLAHLWTLLIGFVFLFNVGLATGLFQVNINVFLAKKCILYLCLHGVQDFFLWKLYIKVSKSSFPNQLWFKFVAIDQTIHLIILFLLFA